ncbi:MAG: hypothetical protein KDD78_05390 [Caldilineaceae bacterium]|nr:hypothetical protein [Caldilineaceae bacterium]
MWRANWGATIQYLTYAVRTTGPYRLQLAQFFLSEVVDEQLDAQFLANKIVARGGEPLKTPHPVPTADTNREILEAMLAAGRRTPRHATPRHATPRHRRLYPARP